MAVCNNEWAFTKRANLYMLREEKAMVPNSVMDVFLMIVMESLKKKPYPYKRCAAVTRPLALFMSKQEHTTELAR